MATQLTIPASSDGAEHITHRIQFLRGMKTILDEDLADLYGVPTSQINRQVKRNPDRFPPDFMFQLTFEETATLRCQNGISNPGSREEVASEGTRGGRRYLPYAFTEQGVAMLSSVLKSPRAVQVNIAIMRVFVRMREFAAAHSELSQRLEQLERRYQEHDEELASVFEAIRQLVEPEPRPPGRRIGFPVKS